MTFAEILPTLKIHKCGQVGSSQFASRPKSSGSIVLWVTISRVRDGGQETRGTSGFH